MTKKITKKIGLPRKIISVLALLVSLAFVFILLIRLFKAIAVAITLFLNNPLSDNVYLVTLAATYLNRDMTGSYLKIYGLWIIFFLQSIMAIYIHIREQGEKSDKDLSSLFKMYRSISFAYLVGTLSFLIILIPNTSNIQFLDSNQLLIPKSADTVVYDAWNIVNSIPTFKLLVELIMIIGILIALPSFFIDLKNELSTSEDDQKSTSSKESKSDVSEDNDTVKGKEITLDSFKEDT